MDLDALYKLTHGLYVLGAKDGERYVGSIVDAVMQAANQPVVVCLSCANTSYTKEIIEKTNEFSLSVLSKNVNPFVIANFGFQSSRNINKWDFVEFYEEGALPFLKDNVATLSCKVLQKIIYDSNTLFLAEVYACSNNKNEAELTYNDYRSYFKDKVIESRKNMLSKPLDSNSEKKAIDTNTSEEVKASEKHWVCSVCDYVYDEDVPFEELPESWTCPICGVPKSFFVLK